MLVAHTLRFLAPPILPRSFTPFLLFSFIFLLSRMRPISSALSRSPSVAIDQAVLYHDATCAHTLYRRCRIMAIRQCGFASINCHSNQCRSYQRVSDSYTITTYDGAGDGKEHRRHVIDMSKSEEQRIGFYSFRINMLFIYLNKLCLTVLQYNFHS